MCGEQYIGQDFCFELKSGISNDQLTFCKLRPLSTLNKLQVLGQNNSLLRRIGYRQADGLKEADQKWVQVVNLV